MNIFLRQISVLLTLALLLQNLLLFGLKCILLMPVHELIMVLVSARLINSNVTWKIQFLSPRKVIPMNWSAVYIHERSAYCVYDNSAIDELHNAAPVEQYYIMSIYHDAIYKYDVKIPNDSKKSRSWWSSRLGFISVRRSGTLVRLTTLLFTIRNIFLSRVRTFMAWFPSIDRFHFAT